MGKYFAPLVLRAALGMIFVAHGAPKLFIRSAEVVAFFAKLGLPFPVFLVILVGSVELVGGVALLVGLWTRAAAALLACVMVGAIVLVKGGQGLVGGYEFDLALLAGVVSLMLTGPGAFALQPEKAPAST